MDLGLISYEFLDFHLGFCGMRFQITNSSVVELFCVRFHVVFEVLWNSCKKENVGFLKGMLSKFL